MFRELRQTFNKLRESANLRQAHKKMSSTVDVAIRQRDADGLVALLLEIPEKEGFLSAYGQWLMKEVIMRGHFPTFQAAYTYLDNPNLRLEFEERVNGGRFSFTFYHYSSLLAYAIEKLKPNIAEFIASDARVDVTKGSYGHEWQVSPLKSAQGINDNGGGMERLVQILLTREAELYRKRADEMATQAKQFD